MQAASKKKLALLAFAFILGLFINQMELGSAIKSQPNQLQDNSSQVQVQLQPEQQLTFYYFHNQRRCKTCLGVEEAITQFIQRSFAKELASGQVRLEILNADLEQNQHLVNQFNITFSTLVVTLGTEHKQNHWLRFDEIWKRYANSNNFSRYMGTNLRQLTESAL